MRTEKVEIDSRYGAEYVGRYVFSEITWARRSRIIQRHTKYHPVTGQFLSSDFVGIQAETVWASLREQPPSKPVTLEKLLGEETGIPIELGELFSQVANRLCGVTPHEQRFLSEPSEEVSHAESSPTSGSARNSVGPPTSSQRSQPKQSNSSS